MLKRRISNKSGQQKYRTFGKSRSVRLKEFDYSLPYAYFVTVRCFEGKDFFKNRKLAGEIINCLLELKLKLKVKLFVYCLMPDHLHLLLSPDQGQISIPKFMQIFKGKTTHILWKSGLKGRLWQKSYHDHVMRTYEDLHETASYILNNPVRKKLAVEPLGYPFSRIFDELPVL
jgi:putative transposase